VAADEDTPQDGGPDQADDPAWWLFGSTDEPHDRVLDLPKAPPWRSFQRKVQADRGKGFEIDPQARDIINTGLYLRRPLLILGRPGVGKTTLAYAIARQLRLGRVLRWSITSRTELKDGLYSYDAIGRLQESSLGRRDAAENGRNDEEGRAPAPIERFLKLGPLGTAFAASKSPPEGRPRLLLIDEIDKSDIDLPNDLLHIFEDGGFGIPELERLPGDAPVDVMPDDARPGDPPIPIAYGRVSCEEFPVVVMTSNGEREFPPAFRRRCLELTIQPPDGDALRRIVEAQLGELPGFDAFASRLGPLIERFIERRDRKHLATDQLLHAVFLALRDVDIERRMADKDALIDQIWHWLDAGE
jgi:MoxR-like ATPase